MEASGLNLWQIIWDSGIVVKLVLLILVAASVLSWAVIFSKRKLIKRSKQGNSEFLKLYRESGNLAEVLSRSAELDSSPFKTLFQFGYGELMKVKETSGTGSRELQDHFERFGFGVLERALKNGANEANKNLDYLLSTLASIGSITPFIGLFGTVWGIIDSFTGLASGGGTLDAVAPGIAEALVATAVGLAAAIPAVWAFNSFSNQVSVINTDMESFQQEILNTIERSLMKG